MKKTLVLFFMLLVLCFTCACNYSYANTEENSYNLFFPDMSERTNPNDLLVMVFLYDDYIDHNEKTDYVFNMTDQEIETKYHNEIFGSGNIDEQTWSVNDFYKENSNGKFYFNPILIGDNTTGIYPIRFNKTYNMENFSSDIKEGFKTLTDKGFVPSGFDVIWHKDESGAGYWVANPEKHVLCIFPNIAVEHWAEYDLCDNLSASVTVIKYSSVISTVTHELGHAIEMPDLYGQKGQATLMGETTLQSTIPDLRYPGASNNYTLPAHVDPLHKITFGWHDYEIVDKNSTVKLYPTTSPLYNIVIVPTEDNNQYYIIENRKADSFESQITMYSRWADIDDLEDACYSNYEGINIWRVDKLGYDELGAYQACDRKGDFVISVLQNPKDAFFPRRYSNISDSSSNLKESTNIKIAYLQKNEDNSIDIDISFDDKYTNSYVVRYNANDGTNNYVDKSYFYGQTVDFSKDIFSENEKEIIGWNTKPDGSGTAYNVYDNVYGLSDENETVVNLYAQWKKDTYTVKFHINGVEGLMPDVTDVAGMYVLPNCDAQYYDKNFEFKGWMYLGELYLPGSQIFVDSDIDLFANFELKSSFKVNFNVDDGSMVETQTVARGGTIKEPESPTKEGYTFMGWYEDATCQFKFYFGRTIYADMTLYAKWVKNENIIKNISINVETPTVGDKVTIEKFDEYFWNWDTQKPQVEITIPNGSNYHLFDFDGECNYMNWITSLEYEFEPEPFIGTFEYNTDYYARIFIETDSEYFLSDDVEVIVNGKNVDKILYIYDNYIELGVKLTTPSEKIIYKIIEGENQTYIVEEEKDFIVKANGEISKFDGLKVDDKILEPSNYIVVSGSTVVTLKKEYLNTLAEGKHTLTFLYSDGEVSTDFTIVKEEIKDDTNILPDNDKNDTDTDTSVDTEIKEETTDRTDKNTTSSSPKTGDNIILWVVLILVSTLGILGTCKYIKKRD
ncbi:MAG: InlB B-repeat-containing protein [Clostridia bacterium]|nr:InlB B-repeat-containing protein [Clostridia bacterium]